jgi:putative FmdB family regulatory protein
MPLYVYACCTCGKELEKLEPYSAPLIQQCPECHKESSLKRKLAVSNFALSGKGWYKDGY